MAEKKIRQRGSRRITKRKQKKQIIIGVSALCALLVFVVIYTILNSYVSKYPKDTIYENVFIGQVEVSGMTKKEAKAAMEEHLAEIQALEMTMKVDDQEAVVVLSEIELNHKDMDKTIDEAARYGKEGGVFKRYFALKRQEKTPLVLDEDIAVNEELLTQVIEEKAYPLTGHAQNAAIQRSDTGFTIIEEKAGTTVSMEESVAAILKYLQEEWECEDFSIELSLIKEEPEITSKDLETIQDELGTFSTDAGGGSRWQNLSTGVSKINGTILLPGEEASVHDLTAPYDEEHGYVAAGSYENGQVVDTFGGGICQVSTTLYNALLLAEVEIVERYPHSMIVSYVEPSRDAAIAGDYKDLVFKNNYDTPIYIAGEIDSANQLRFTVYGKETRDPNRTVEYESETLSTEEYKRIYIEDPSAELGSKRREGSPHTGREAKLWKIVYENGVEVERKAINKSSYKKSDQTTYIGTKANNPEASAVLSSAIGSQDPDTIEAAIAQAKALEGAAQSNGNNE